MSQDKIVELIEKGESGIVEFRKVCKETIETVSAL